MTAHSSTIRISLGSLFLNHRSPPILVALWVKRILSRKQIAIISLCVAFMSPRRKTRPYLELLHHIQICMTTCFKKGFQKINFRNIGSLTVMMECL